MYGDLEIDYSLEVWYGLYDPAQMYPDEGEEWEDARKSKPESKRKRLGRVIKVSR